MRRKRAVPTPEPRWRINETRDPDLLASIAFAKMLTTRQAERLHFRSRRTAERRLRALFDLGLIRSVKQGEALHRDNVHLLTAEGIGLLAARGSFEGLSPPAPGRLPRPQKLTHGLAVRDVLVALLLAERAGTLGVEDFLFEDDLAGRQPFASAGLVPDGLATITASGQPLAVGAEVDLGTERLATVREKLETWKRLLELPEPPARRLLIVAPAGRRLTGVAEAAQAAGLGEAGRAYSFEALDESAAWLGAPLVYERPVRTVRTGGASGMPVIGPRGAFVQGPFRSRSGSGGDGGEP